MSACQTVFALSISLIVCFGGDVQTSPGWTGNSEPDAREVIVRQAIAPFSRALETIDESNAPRVNVGDGVPGGSDEGDSGAEDEGAKETDERAYWQDAEESDVRRYSNHGPWVSVQSDFGPATQLGFDVTCKWEENRIDERIPDNNWSSIAPSVSGVFKVALNSEVIHGIYLGLDSRLFGGFSLAGLAGELGFGVATDVQQSAVVGKLGLYWSMVGAADIGYTYQHTLGMPNKDTTDALAEELQGHFFSIRLSFPAYERSID